MIHLYKGKLPSLAKLLLNPLENGVVEEIFRPALSAYQQELAAD